MSLLASLHDNLAIGLSRRLLEPPRLEATAQAQARAMQQDP
jgi:hypothetical protein